MKKGIERLWILGGILASAAVVVLVIQNLQDVELTLFLWTIRVSVALLGLSSVFLGMVVMGSLMMIRPRGDKALKKAGPGELSAGPKAAATLNRPEPRVVAHPAEPKTPAP